METPEGFQPLGNRQSDPAKAVKTDGAAAQRQRRENKRTLLGPASLTQPLFGNRETPDRIEEQANSGIGDLFRQHIRRVGHRDTTLRRMHSVHAIIADAEIGDDFQLGKYIDEFGWDFTLDCDSCNAGRKLGRDQRWIGGGDENGGEMVRQTVEHALVHFSGHENTLADIGHVLLLAELDTLTLWDWAGADRSIGVSAFPA